MSEFHYVRTRGEDGGVDACEGPAIGLDLETVLRDGLPPWKVALEIVAALCEILDIADQDGEVHGEVHPKYVFIDETGAVSLEGFGIKRRKCRAPEGVPKDTRSDLYGLGYVAYRCFCSHTLPDAVPTEASAHDDFIVDAALELDLSGVSPEMQGDVQWYVAKLMDFDPAQRPGALDSWRTFIAFANATQGADMAEWCASALDGGGARRAETRKSAPQAPKRPTDDEELGGPVLVRGGIAARVAFDDPAAQSSGPKGATAFWTKEDMKRALDETPEAPPRAGETPARGVRPMTGAAATSFWSQSQLDAIARGDENAPRPRRLEGEGERRRVTAAQRPPSTPNATRPEPRPAPSRSSSGAMGPASVYNVPSSSARPPTTAGVLAPSSPSSPNTAGLRPPAPPSTTFQPAPVIRSGAATATADAPAAPSSPTAPNPAPSAFVPSPHQAPTQRFDMTPEEKAQMIAAAKAQQAQRPPPAPTSPATGPLQPGLGLNPAAKRPAPPEPERPSAPKAAVAPPNAEGQDQGSRGGLTFVLFSGGLAAVGVAVVSVLLILLVIVLAVVLWPKDEPKNVPLPIQPVPAISDPDLSPIAPPIEPRDPAPAQPDPAQPAPAGPKPATPKPATPKPATPKPAPVSPVPAPVVPVPVKPPPTPKPAPSGSNARVTVKSSGRGSVTACVSSKESFQGQTSFEIEGYLLPATCLVKIDGAQGVFQVYGSGTITCDKQGTVVLCDKQQVP